MLDHVPISASSQRKHIYFFTINNNRHFSRTRELQPTPTPQPPLPLSSPSVPPLPPFDCVRVRFCYVSMLGTCVCASADLMQRGALDCVKTEVKSSHNAKRHTAPSEAKETQRGEHELASFPEKLGPSGLCYLLRPPCTELCMHNNEPWTNMWNEGVTCRSSCALCWATDQSASFLETSSVAGFRPHLVSA